MKIHPSSLSKIMTSAKGGWPEKLSVGAMTYCYEQAKEFVYNYHQEISDKKLDKGNIVEDDSIRLYNDVFFTRYKKNDKRISNEWLTGECDIITGGQERARVIDIKSPWSLQTFPALSSIAEASAKKSGYDWQVRAYMMLWDVNFAEIAYCMVSTPDDLIGYENPDIHYVDNIDPTLRITRVFYERDEEKENLIKIKCSAAISQIEQYIEQITTEHAQA